MSPISKKNHEVYPFKQIPEYKKNIYPNMLISMSLTDMYPNMLPFLTYTCVTNLNLMWIIKFQLL